MTSPPIANPALSVLGLRVRRGGREVLAVDALSLARGETVAVLGPNGAGKSTLLLACALLLPADGRVSYDGVARTSRNAVALRRRTSTVFQEPALLDVSVRRNVEEALSIHGVPRADRARRATEWLDRLGVSAQAEARPHQLSGGEAQRVSLARALAVEPRVLFLDEPFSGLDLATRSRLVGEIRALLRETGVTALLSTHDQAEAAVLADRVLVLDRGRPLALGGAAEVLARPPTPAVAGLLGFTVIEPEAAAALGIDARGAAVAVPPSALRVGPPGGPGSAATVHAIESVAGGVRLRLQAAAVLSVDVSVADFHEAGWRMGDVVSVQVNADRVARFPAR